MLNVSNSTECMYSSRTSNQPAFKAKSVNPELISISPYYRDAAERKLARLYNEVGIIFNETRANLRKKKLSLNNISFVTRSSKDGVVTLRPVCNSKNNAFAVQFENKGIIERIFVDKDSKCNFVYEHSVKTEHGSYVTKTFNSKKENNPDFVENISQKLNKYLAIFIKDYNHAKEPNFLK